MLRAGELDRGAGGEKEGRELSYGRGWRRRMIQSKPERINVRVQLTVSGRTEDG
jgi:hypothetical protein